MPKEALKRKIIELKGNVSDISGAELPAEKSLFDTHRKKPKRKNGGYVVKNTVLVLPVEHMKEHGTYKEREPELDKLKTLIDDRNQILKIKNKISNQIRAYERGTDNPNAETLKDLAEMLGPFKKKVASKTRAVEKYVKKIKNPLAQMALSVKGVGPITVALLLVYVDIEKARHGSSLWKYVGLHTASHSRYTKGEAGGGNKTLRTALYNFAESQIKLSGPYRQDYDREKFKKSKSEKMVMSRTTQGKLVEMKWSETKPSHRHGHAMRIMIKMFLFHYWYVARTLAGLPTSNVYAEEILGAGHKTIMPSERGWSEI